MKSLMTKFKKMGTPFLVGEIKLAKTINLNFDGYWIEVGKSGVPAKAGIYVVYVCKYNPPPKDNVDLKKIIYIGEAKDVKDRISNHEKLPIWLKEVPEGSTLCYSFAGATSPDRERAECALINHHKPKCNEECKDKFPYEETTVISTGKKDRITSPITVKTKK